MNEHTRTEQARLGADCGRRILFLTTLSFGVCFAAWVTNAVLVTFLVDAGIFSFTESQVGWLLALPILTGAVTRVPLGIMTDRIGGRRVLTGLMLVVAVALWGLSLAGSYAGFLAASLAFGLAGGSFAVGVGYVSVWFPKEKQGTVLGVFGMGNIGAAATTLFAPRLLTYFTAVGANPDGWRMLPRTYAVLVALTAIGFFLLTQEKRTGAAAGSLATRLAPLKSIVVWRFGFYYFFVFGGFITLAQWLVPYGVNVYQMSVAEAGLLASAFSLPSGLAKGAGGWLSDRYGARRVMRWVFQVSILVCLVLIVPRMEINSPGEGVMAKDAGAVTEIGSEGVTVGARNYRFRARPPRLPAESDSGNQFLPIVTTWHEPVVEHGSTIQRKQLLGRGVTNIYYPANLWAFVIIVVIFGLATGVGAAGVLKFIPDQFPTAVGAVGGMVGLIGALGGFVLPPIFGYLLRVTGLWSSCWAVLLVLGIACLVWMEYVAQKILSQEAPELSRLIERRPPLSLTEPVTFTDGTKAGTAEGLLKRIPFFSGLGAEQLKTLARLAGHRKAEADEVLFREGDVGDTLHIILSGRVRITIASATGNRMELATPGPGEFFGELALIDGKPRSAEAVAIEKSEFLLIDRQEFLRLIASSPLMLADLLVGLTGEVRGSLEKMARGK